MRVPFLTTLTLLFFVISCDGNVADVISPDMTSGPCTVGFKVGNSIQTRTHAQEDALLSAWDDSDEISLWAVDKTGKRVIDACPFGIYAMDDEGAFFTATLDSAMPDGVYTYFATCPRPVSVSGDAAVFNVPSVQDGKASGGSDVMVAYPETGHALAPLEGNVSSGDELSLHLAHILHRFRFYITDSASLHGEKVRKIVATVPSAIVGILRASISDPAAEPVLTSGSNSVTIDLEDALEFSSPQGMHYACASVVPFSAAEGDGMTLSVYTDSKVARTDVIPLQSRTFAAGHSTPVRMVPASVHDLYRLNFRIDSNNLGEDVTTLTLTAPEGCKWSDTGSNVMQYAPGDSFGAGCSFELEFENEAAFRGLSGKSVVATYDSESVTISESLVMPDLTRSTSASVSLDVPYLLYEDFSAVATFSSHDEYGVSNAGSRSPLSFLNGWTGARIGAEAGKCIRIACRRETSADYDARVDSAPLNGKLKKAVNLDVSFDYGADNKFGGISIITNPDVGQNCYIGYVTSAQGYKSGDKDGKFESGNSFYVKEYTGSYTSTPDNETYILHSVPATSPVRITWRTEIEHQAGTNNTTAWLYLDNIKVKIAK